MGPNDANIFTLTVAKTEDPCMTVHVSLYDSFEISKMTLVYRLL